MGDGVIEFHREHLPPEAPVVWQGFQVPSWQNRPVQPPGGPDYRIMLGLSALCGVAGLSGYFLGGTSVAAWAVPLAFAVSYLAGGWYATREVLGEMRHGKIDVHFLMIIVALGALFVNAWAEGATLLFLFSLSGGLEQLPIIVRRRPSVHFSTRRRSGQSDVRMVSGWRCRSMRSGRLTSCW